MASMCVWAGNETKQDKKMQRLEVFCLFKKKNIEKHKCFLSSAHAHVVVFFPLKTYLHLYSRKIPLGFILMPYPALPYLKVQIYLSLYQVTFFP